MLHAIETTVSDVFITNELAWRRPESTDYLREKLALQDLASRMADRPAEMLPRFVDLAMEMAGGVSAGLSLYEERPAPGVFRWQYLRGRLERFNGATTPRHFSPCGVTLDQNAPVLSRYPEQVYTWIADAKIVVPEVLLVPLYIGSTVPLGTLWIVSDEEGHFDSGHARVMTELASFVGFALRMIRTEERLHRALEEQETLAKEMSHRLKNMFAVTDALIRISAKHVTTKNELADVLSGRLHALADAHALVRRNFSETEPTSRASELGELIRIIVRPHQGIGDDAVARFSFEGPSIRCGDHAVNGIALVIHELATNAAKYGALKADEGHVSIRWRDEAGKLVLTWVERGGPPIEALPASDGFGRSLAQTTVVRQFGGTLHYDWRRDGVAVTITVPNESLAA